MIAWKHWKKFDKGTQSMVADASAGRFLRFPLILSSQPLDITGLGWVNCTLADLLQAIIWNNVNPNHRRMYEALREES